LAREDLLPTLLEIADEQGGYLTTAQAARLGVEPSRLSRLTKSHDLRRIRHGVYAMRHAHHRLEDDIGAWLAVDRQRLPWERRDAVAVLSHASAAAIDNLGTVIPQLPALTVRPEDRSATRANDIELHIAQLTADDWRWVSTEGVRIPVTTPARTIVDLVLAHEEVSYVQRALSEALADGRTSPDDLLDAARRRKSRTASLQKRLRSLMASAQ
jgi:predicted transcriptional regulator of viral defense system